MEEVGGDPLIGFGGSKEERCVASHCCYLFIYLLSVKVFSINAFVCLLARLPSPSSIYI